MDVQLQRRYSRHSLVNHLSLGIQRKDVFWKGPERLEGFDPIKRDPIPGVSEYDQAKWPASYWPPMHTHMTKLIGKVFLLSPDEYVDLCFTKRRIPRSDLIAHEYLSRELEQRAWEKFGGQVGLDAARARRDQRVAQQQNQNPEGNAYNNRRPQPAQAPKRENGHGGGGGYIAPMRADYGVDVAQPQRPIAAQPESEGRYFYARAEPSYPQAVSIEGERYVRESKTLMGKFSSMFSRSRS